MKLFNIFKKATKNSTLANIQPLSEIKLDNMINGIDVTTTSDGADKTTKGTGKSASGATNSGA